MLRVAVDLDPAVLVIFRAFGVINEEATARKAEGLDPRGRNVEFDESVADCLCAASGEADRPAICTEVRRAGPIFASARAIAAQVTLAVGVAFELCADARMAR